MVSRDSRAAPAEGDSRAISDPKFLKLVEILRGLGRVLVAYSGGADSAFLLKVARDILGENAVGVLAFSESLDRSELEAARAVAKDIGAPIRVIETREYDREEYRRNDGSRCYHCKTELFVELGKLARAEGYPFVVDGSNFDDQGDHRPGLLARTEQGVRSPLLEAGLAKAEIREFSRRLGLPTWDKPAAPCLSSRIPYGSEVTREKLRQVETAEAGLRALGFRVVRVRHHDTIARIEVPPEDLPRLLEEETRLEAIRRVKAAGFLFVALDLQGFRSGSLNDLLAAPRARSAGAGAGSSPLIPLSTIQKIT